MSDRHQLDTLENELEHYLSVCEASDGSDGHNAGTIFSEYFNLTWSIFSRIVNSNVRPFRIDTLELFNRY